MDIQIKTTWSKIITFLTAIVLALLIGLMSLGGSKLLAKSQDMTKVLIAFNVQPGPAEETLVRSVGGEIKYTYHLVPAIAATVPQQALEGLQRNPNVTAVELDIEVHAIDAELDNAWGVKVIGAGAAHSNGFIGTDVRVGILDTGIDTNHPELITALERDNSCSASFVTGQSIEDGHGHGTHVAGTIAALDDDNGVVGVAPGVTLCIYKVLSNSGSGSYSDIIAALQQAVIDGVHITNNSYGSSGDPGTIVQDAFDNAYAAGVLHIAAAGNSGNTLGTGENCIFPARWSSVVATAATTNTDNHLRASFSSTCDEVELAAPGSQINSTIPGGGYGLMSGTSMASPHAAGTAALALVANPSSTNEQLRRQLQNTANDLGQQGRDPHYGFGLVDAAEISGGGFVNTPPQAHDQSLTTAQDTPVDITLSGSDADSDTLTFSLESSSPDNGSLSGTAPNLTYQPNQGFSGLDSFTFTVNDGEVTSAPATVSLTVTPENIEPGDTVTITKATYHARKRQLDVEATSSAGGSVTLTVIVDTNSQAPVEMSYNSKKDKYQVSIGLSNKPSQVEVNSDGGGSASVTGSEIGGRG